MDASSLATCTCKYLEVRLLIGRSVEVIAVSGILAFMMLQDNANLAGIRIYGTSGLQTHEGVEVCGYPVLVPVLLLKGHMYTVAEI